MKLFCDVFLLISQKLQLLSIFKFVVVVNLWILSFVSYKKYQDPLNMNNFVVPLALHRLSKIAHYYNWSNWWNVFNLCLQILCLANQIQFTEQCEAAMKDNNLQECLLELESQLEGYTSADIHGGDGDSDQMMHVLELKLKVKMKEKKNEVTNCLHNQNDLGSISQRAKIDRNCKSTIVA